MNKEVEFYKPNWDEYYMGMACYISIRSPDTATKHGAVIVDKNMKPLGIGYNGYPSKAKDDSLYPKDRIYKLKVTLHAETNAILNCSINPDGGTIYVTGFPCCRCVTEIIQSGIKRIIYGGICSHSSCVSEEDIGYALLMIDNHDIELMKYNGEHPIEILSEVCTYLEHKDWKIIDAEKICQEATGK